MAKQEKKKFESYSEQTKRQADALGTVAALRNGYTWLKRFVALAENASTAQDVKVLLGDTEQSEMAAVAAKVKPLLAELESKYKEAVGL